MVVFLIILLLLLPYPVDAITEAELREMNAVWRQKDAKRKQRIQAKDLKSHIPAKARVKKMEASLTMKKAEATETGVQPASTAIEKEQVTRDSNSLSTKYKKLEQGPGFERPRQNSALPFMNSGVAEASPIPQASFKEPAVPVYTPGKKGIYIAPPRLGGFDPQTDTAEADTTRIFGIRIGTWIEAELKRPASNTEPGLIELYTTEHIQGDKRTLPLGVTFFAEGRYNSGSKKLDFSILKGITPDGLEFDAKGLVFDLQRTAGLHGVISTDSEMILERSTSNGAFAAGSAVAGQLAQGGVAGAAGQAAAESFLSDTKSSVNESTQLKKMIRAQPQKLLIRVEETF